MPEEQEKPRESIIARFMPFLLAQAFSSATRKSDLSRDLFDRVWELERRDFEAQRTRSQELQDLAVTRSYDEGVREADRTYRTFERGEDQAFRAGESQKGRDQSAAQFGQSYALDVRRADLADDQMALAQDQMDAQVRQNRLAESDSIVGDLLAQIQQQRLMPNEQTAYLDEELAKITDPEVKKMVEERRRAMHVPASEVGRLFTADVLSGLEGYGDFGRTELPAFERRLSGAGLPVPREQMGPPTKEGQRPKPTFPGEDYEGLDPEIIALVERLAGQHGEAQDRVLRDKIEVAESKASEFNAQEKPRLTTGQIIDDNGNLIAVPGQRITVHSVDAEGNVVTEDQLTWDKVGRGVPDWVGDHQISELPPAIQQIFSSNEFNPDTVNPSFGAALTNINDLNAASALPRTAGDPTTSENIFNVQSRFDRPAWHEGAPSGQEMTEQPGRSVPRMETQRAGDGITHPTTLEMERQRIRHAFQSADARLFESEEQYPWETIASNQDEFQIDPNERLNAIEWENWRTRIDEEGFDSLSNEDLNRLADVTSQVQQFLRIRPTTDIEGGVPQIRNPNITVPGDVTSVERPAGDAMSPGMTEQVRDPDKVIEMGRTAEGAFNPAGLPQSLTQDQQRTLTGIGEALTDTTGAPNLGRAIARSQQGGEDRLPIVPTGIMGVETEGTGDTQPPLQHLPPALHEILMKDHPPGTEGLPLTAEQRAIAENIMIGPGPRQEGERELATGPRDNRLEELQRGGARPIIGPGAIVDQTPPPVDLGGGVRSDLLRIMAGQPSTLPEVKAPPRITESPMGRVHMGGPDTGRVAGQTPTMGEKARPFPPITGQGPPPPPRNVVGQQHWTPGMAQGEMSPKGIVNPTFPMAQGPPPLGGRLTPDPDPRRTQQKGGGPPPFGMTNQGVVKPTPRMGQGPPVPPPIQGFGPIGDSTTVTAPDPGPSPPPMGQPPLTPDAPLHQRSLPSVPPALGGKFGEEITGAVGQHFGSMGPAQQEQMANLVNAIMQIESSGEPSAIGTSGEYGLMQLMPGTAADYGLTEETRLQPGANLGAGTNYLADLMGKYQGYGIRDLESLLTAYNRGMGNLQKQQRGASPMPLETVQYLAKIKQQLGPEASAAIDQLIRQHIDPYGSRNLIF